MAPAHEWDADTSTSEAQARQLIAEQFPVLAQAPISTLGSGWDNTAFLVDESWVFRFPRRKLAASLLANEIRALPALASRLPLAIPSPGFVGEATSSFPYPFAGYAIIPGRTGCQVPLDEGARIDLAQPLARFLKSLHEIPGAVGRGLGIETDQLRRLDVARRSASALMFIDALVTRQDVTEIQGRTLRQIVDDATHAPPPATAMLVHGDLYIRHLIIAGDGKLAGVIDWGDLHLGDAAVDLMIAYLALPGSARRRFFEHYGAIGAGTMQLARFRAVLHLGHLCAYAHDVGDHLLLDEMRREAGFLLEP